MARIAVPDDEFRDQWSVVAPALDPVTRTIAGSRGTERACPTRGCDSASTLGANVALLFGAGHDGKDVDLVARVFADLADWQLVVTGDVAGEYRQRSGPGREAVVIGGYVDETMRARSRTAPPMSSSRASALSSTATPAS